MPFDGTQFPPPREDRPPRRDNAITAFIILLAIALLVTPLTLGTLIDLIRYARG